MEVIADDALRAAGVTVAAERITAGPIDLAGLDEVERGRAAGMTPEREAGFVAGRRLARILLQEFATGSALDARCARCGRPHAAPRPLDGAALLGVAHTTGITVACAASAARCAALGVDVERDDAETRRRVEELAPQWLGDVGGGVVGWTRVEAVLKADGRGLRVDPAGLRWERRHRDLWASMPGRDRPLKVLTVQGPDDAVVSVAVDPVDTG